MESDNRTQEPSLFISSGRKDARTVELLNRLFQEGANIGASDIHFEDEDGGACVIRYRIGGLLQEVMRVDRQTSLEIDSKIRSKCRMSLSERLDAQDGRMFIEADGRMVDVRVSLVPTRTGQSIVCRLLDQRNAAKRLDDVLMPGSVRQALNGVIEHPDGLVLLTGPTGSGKTSTLYAMLNQLNTPEAKILTVEDPVEYRLPGACQVNVNDKLTFGRALRAFLRQDPDIILVGEIRDAETAKIAVEASMTGHLVLSTLHANDATTTLTRLVDLGVDSFTLGAVLRCVIAQRLVRRLCPHCRISYEPSNGEKEWLEINAENWAGQSFYRSEGCDQCQYTGDSGRIPIMEMVVGDAQVRHAIVMNSRAELSRAAKRQEQHQTLVEAGMSYAAIGEISLVEVRRIASAMDYSHPHAHDNASLPKQDTHQSAVF